MRFLLFLFALLLARPLLAQVPDTTLLLPPTAQDTVVTNKIKKMNPTNQQTRVILPDSAGLAISKDTVARKVKTGFFSKNYPDPSKAALLSIIPGAGQIYNKRWWKVPIVYAGLGGLTWLEITNIRRYREAKINYKWLVDGDPATVVDPYYEGADATSLKNFRDLQRRYVEQSSLVLGLAYLLSITDAYVDAHLSRFDVSEDLSLRVAPKAQAGPDAGFVLGVGLSLEFGGTRNSRP